MYFHKVTTNSVNLQPFRTKQIFLIRAHGYSGAVFVNGSKIANFNHSLLVIPAESLIQCDIQKDRFDGYIDLFTINKRDRATLKEKLLLINSFILDRKSNADYILTKHNDLASIFSLNHSLVSCHLERELKSTTLKQSILHLLLILYTQGHDIGLLFQQVCHLSVAERLTKLFLNDPMYKWTLENTAKNIFTSSSTLRRNLSREGTSFSNLLNSVRLGLAVNYLTFTNFNIFKVSEMSGFNSSAYFCTLFKSKYGMTPQKFRQTSKETNSLN
ncbi:MAG TPA: AraC family transcriptional regulator [Vibrio sp.]|nr:AraC family transcriptional regulator [Vibrio sp.]